MSLRTILQPYTGTFGEALHNELLDERWTHFDASIAFVRRSGARDIDSALRTFLRSGGKARIVAGLDLEGTTFEGLSQILGALAEGDGEIAGIEKSSEGATFHPKSYLFRQKEDGELKDAKWLIGSSNLTGSALYLNDEAVAAWRPDVQDTQARQTIGEIRQWSEDLFASLEPLTADSLVALFRDGRVPSESVLNRKSWSNSKRSKVSGTATDRPKRRLPPPRGTPGSPLVQLPEPNDERLSGSVAVSTESVNPHWSKVLDPSAAQQPPSPDSSPTGVLRLSTSGHPIDRNTWFRHELFGSADWSSSTNKTGQSMEEALVDVEVSIASENIGTFTVRISHVLGRIASQNNVPTTLHWGSELGSILRSTDYSGYTVEITHIGDQFFLSLYP